MKVWAILSQKGGSGKTTLALHLAITAEKKKKRAVVIDLDPQRSAEKWANVRDEEAPVIIAGEIDHLSDMIKAAEEGGAQIVVIDTPPRLERGSIAAAKLADLIIIPARPSILDLPAIGDTVDLINLAGQEGKAVIILNAVAARTNEAKLGLEAAKDFGLPVCPYTIGERADFRKALTAGKGVTEMNPKSKASEEIIKLYQWVSKR